MNCRDGLRSHFCPWLTLVEPGYSVNCTITDIGIQIYIDCLDLLTIIGQPRLEYHYRDDDNGTDGGQFMYDQNRVLRTSSSVTLVTRLAVWTQPTLTIEAGAKEDFITTR